MSDELDALLAKLTPAERAQLAARLTTGDAIGGDKVSGDKVVGDKVSDPQGTVSVSDDGRINGVAVGINLGTIIYGRDPREDERRRLVWYLDRLAAKLYRLPLRGLDETLDQGQGVSLPQVYVMLATMSRVEVAGGRAGSKKLRRYYQDGDIEGAIKEAYHLDYALPQEAIVAAEPVTYRQKERRSNPVPGRILYRAQLVTEAVHAHSQLILLGDPGSGKSTFLRHLAWAMARRGLDQLSDATVLFGWDDQRRRLPIILPLRTLAGQLARQGVSAQTVYTALLAEIQSYNITGADDMLNAGLHQGAVLLLFDGLDEVPLDAIPDVTADRRTTLRAVRDFTQMHTSTAAVLTCRTRAFDEPLRELLGWPASPTSPR